MKQKALRILLMDESADWKHILTTVSSETHFFGDIVYGKDIRPGEEMTCEFVLVESNHHVQAKNILLMTILSDKCYFPGISITNAFTALLYNMHLDKESFCILKSTLKRFQPFNKHFISKMFYSLKKIPCAYWNFCNGIYPYLR